MDVMGFTIGYDTIALAVIVAVTYALPRVAKLTPWSWDDRIAEASAALAEELGIDPDMLFRKVKARLVTKFGKEK